MTAKKKDPPIKRQDRPGHFDPEHVASLMAMSEAGKPHDADRGFVPEGRTSDPLAEELAEDAVIAMTSGEDALTDDLAAPTEEESGGPFVASSAKQEFARGTDASNPQGADREPFPRT
jgi:hypothetical protein